MGIFDDDFSDQDGDFTNRWEKFNKRMTEDEEFRREMEKSNKDFQKLMRMLLDPKNYGTPLFPEDLKNNFDVPENGMGLEKGKDENGEWETKNWASPDGSLSYSYFSRSSNFDDEINLPDEIANRWEETLNKKKEINPEKIKKVKLMKLQSALDKAVELELYEKAAEIKKMMEEIKTID